MTKIRLPARTPTHHLVLIPAPGAVLLSTTSIACTSSNVVYLIRCRACGKVYIGETGRRLGDRFREHLRSTRLTDTDLPVGRHFASSGHSVKDISVSVIRSGFQSTLERRRFEAKAIFQHWTLHPEGLNTDFSSFRTSLEGSNPCGLSCKRGARLRWSHQYHPLGCLGRW